MLYKEVPGNSLILFGDIGDLRPVKRNSEEKLTWYKLKDGRLLLLNRGLSSSFTHPLGNEGRNHGERMHGTPLYTKSDAKDRLAFFAIDNFTAEDRKWMQPFETSCITPKGYLREIKSDTTSWTDIISLPNCDDPLFKEIENIENRSVTYPTCEATCTWWKVMYYGWSSYEVTDRKLEYMMTMFPVIRPSDEMPVEPRAQSEEPIMYVHSEPIPPLCGDFKTLLKG